MLIDVQGARLVFARLAADSLSGPLDGADPGLYTVDLTVGTCVNQWFTCPSTGWRL